MNHGHDEFDLCACWQNSLNKYSTHAHVRTRIKDQRTQRTQQMPHDDAPRPDADADADAGYEMGCAITQNISHLR